MYESGGSKTARACCVCGALARWECAQCVSRGAAGLDHTAYCAACVTRVHPPTLQHAPPKPLTINEEYITILECCPIPRVYMELFAVLCIETSHYVAFVKAGSGHDAAWCLFDSMADRKGERNGYNIPEIVEVAGARWTSEEGALALHAAAPLDRHLPPHAKRLLADAYMCFYRSPDAGMYR